MQFKVGDKVKISPNLYKRTNIVIDKVCTIESMRKLGDVNIIILEEFPQYALREYDIQQLTKLEKVL